MLFLPVSKASDDGNSMHEERADCQGGDLFIVSAFLPE
jgi:hypothetical protein